MSLSLSNSNKTDHFFLCFNEMNSQVLYILYFKIQNVNATSSVFQNFPLQVAESCLGILGVFFVSVLLGLNMTSMGHVLLSSNTSNSIGSVRSHVPLVMQSETAANSFSISVPNQYWQQLILPGVWIRAIFIGMEYPA